MFDWLGARLNRLRQSAREEPVQALGPSSQPEAAGPLQLYLAGRVSEAEHDAQARLAGNETDAESMLVQALIALDRGESAAALRLFEGIVQAAPEDVEAWVGLGRARAAAGRRAAAKAAFQQARQLQPDHPRLLPELALEAAVAGRADEAAALLSKLDGGGTRVAEAHFQLANLLLPAGQLELAGRHLRQAIAADPSHANAHANLGAILKDLNRVQEAAVHLEKALQLQPGLAQAAYNLAMLRIQHQQWGSAAALLRQSLQTAPKQADALYWLGNALMGVGDAVESSKAYQGALRLNSGYVNARWGYVMAQLPAIAMGPTEQADSVQAFARELDKLKSWFRIHRPKEGFRAVGATQPFYLAYVEQDHRALLGSYGALCTSLMAAWLPKAATIPPPAAASGRKLRIGIVSAHIHSHSVWHAIVRGWVEHLDPARFELQLFHAGAGRDAETEWAAPRVARLHHGLGDWTVWAKTVSDARLDVLIYPEIGMDSTTVRLSALRLAPTQLASWGHPITTGLPTIDGFVSAQAFEPEQAASHYTEKLIALPRLGCAYRPYDTVAQRVDLASWGIGPSDRVLLCAGSPFKYAPRDDALLADIARRCSPCKLVFFGEAGDAKPAMLEKRLRLAFDAAAVSFDDHVLFIPWQTQRAFFGLLQQTDVFLDSAGFSGFNTAMQAVQCGAPIVAWEGAYMRGRFASGILRQMGMDEWVACSADEFARCVERLCADKGLRQRVREQMAQASPKLFNDKATVDAFAAYLQELATV
jgi:protein O-GlcNAc transferase